MGRGEQRRARTGHITRYPFEPSEPSAPAAWPSPFAGCVRLELLALDEVEEPLERRWSLWIDACSRCSTFRRNAVQRSLEEWLQSRVARTRAIRIRNRRIGERNVYERGATATPGAR